VISRMLTDGMTKVPKGCRRDFWHFCHPFELASSKAAPPGKSAQRRVIQHTRETLVGSPQGPRRRNQ
jgi:hypothetical protein